MGQEYTFGYGKWKERVMADIIACQALHRSKPTPEETDSPNFYKEAIDTYNRQTVVLAATYIENILKEFLQNVFLAHPERMTSYLAPKEAKKELRGKIDFKTIVNASSKEEFFFTISETAVFHAIQGKNIHLVLERVCNICNITQDLSELENIVLIRNRIIHEASQEVIDETQAEFALRRIWSFLDILKETAEREGVPCDVQEFNVIEDMKGKGGYFLTW